VFVIAELEFLSPNPSFSHIVVDRAFSIRNGGEDCANDGMEHEEGQEDYIGPTILMVPRPSTVGVSITIVGQYRRNTNCSCRA
jgi:hypothetical protein